MKTEVTPEDKWIDRVETRSELAYLMAGLTTTDDAPELEAPLALHIGRMRPVPVRTAEQASRIWQIYRDGFNLAASDSPRVTLKHQGKEVGYVSYNGRVWAGKPTGQPKGMPIAEAANVQGVNQGDWLYVEDMMSGRGTMMEVKAVYGPARAITLEDPTGKMCDRIYVREMEGHDRFFTSFSIN